MDRFRVVICGGGIAAVEGLVRLRTLAGDALDVTVVAPNEDFRYRPLAVDEPFARPGIRRYPMRQITDRTQSEWIQDAGEWVDLSAQVLHTEGGAELRFDALLLAVGGRLIMPFEHVTVFDDEHADEGYHGIIQDIDGGYTRSIVLIVPEGHAWLLPAYELALMTAERAASMWEDGVPSEAGFVPVDEFSRVPGTTEHVFAAGDDTDLPLKHGSLGAQQADVAAAGIAAMAGADVEPEPLYPVVRALLHTGKQPLYITARLENGRVESEVTTEQAWPPDEKVVARELGSFLASLD